MDNAEVHYKNISDWKGNHTINHRTRSVAPPVTYLANRDKTTSGEYKIPCSPKKSGGESNIGIYIGFQKIEYPIYHDTTTWYILIVVLEVIVSKRRPPNQEVA